MELIEDPPLESFTDEFGPIDGAVYAAATTLWARAAGLASISYDPAASQRLLMKACALVTRKRTTAPDAITNLPAYLYRTWQRLVLEELEKENGHRRIEETLTAEPLQLSTEELDRRILLQQIIRHMDDWTRRVFDYLALGFSYEEIAVELGGNGHAIRVKYDRQLKALAQRLNPGGAR
jgi:DNA-directed RNA polymerase specialized sigma24 family protein